MKIRTYIHRLTLLTALLGFLALGAQAQTPVCAEDTVDLQLGAHTGAIQWQSSPDGMNWSIVGGATNPSLKVFPGTTTWYRAEIIDGSCNAIYSDTAQVFHVVAATISASGPLALCPGGSVILTANTGTNYLWSNGSQTQNITVTSPGSYTVTVTDANGCSSASPTAMVTVAPQMTVDAGVDTTTPCQAVMIGGSPTAMGGTPPYTYSWTPTAGLSNPNVANPDANPNQNTLYTVTVTDSNGCSASDSVQVNVSGAGTGTQTFTYTGAPQMFVVPCTDSVSIQVWGAQGGSATNNNCTIGGLGGYAFGDLAVNVGDTIWIYVGGAGMPGDVGGWNGGGSSCAQTTTCSRGGGASDVRVGGQALTNRVIVGGGGGGAEWSGCVGTGGDGGGLSGGTGTTTSGGGQYNGTGGSQVAGGTALGGASGYIGTNGALGVGGNGGSHPSGHAGSGGGGYYGGGGGGADGHGGGGSSYIGGVANGGTTAGQRNGNGEVIITW